MDRKYQVLSASSLIKMLITFKKIDEMVDEPITIGVNVDYLNDRIYFDESELLKDIDKDELEAEILSNLRPPLIEAPEMPPELLQKIQDVRSGNYGGDIPNYQGFTQ